MTSSWFHNPHWTTMHGQPHIKFKCIVFIIYNMVLYHILKWNVLLHFKYCYGDIDMSVHIMKCLFTGKSYNMVWFFLQGRVVLAPLFYVNFADFWLADQLNSLVVVFIDFQYLICFYLTSDNWMSANGKKPTLIASSYLVMCVCLYIYTNIKSVFNTFLLFSLTDINVCDDYTRVIRPLVGCLPAWWRFAQCLRRYRDTKEAFPHLANAGKYATSFLVMLFSTLNMTYSGW